MFRPNRIGTPHILAATDNASTADWTPNASAISSLYTGNVINALPAGEFAQSYLRWAGSEAVTAFQRICIGQQFTIQKPLKGDTKGVELGGSIVCDIGATELIYPVLFRIAAAGGSTLAAVTANSAPSILAEPVPQALAVQAHSYQTQAVSRLPEGTYFHGYALQDTGSGFSLTTFQAEYYVRQLMNQQSIGYEDTLR